ncbi:MAG: cell division protein FtsQ/DivIB [Pararhodobacter sp.]
MSPLDGHGEARPWRGAVPGIGSGAMPAPGAVARSDSAETAGTAQAGAGNDGAGRLPPGGLPGSAAGHPVHENAHLARARAYPRRYPPESWVVPAGEQGPDRAADTLHGPARRIVPGAFSREGTKPDTVVGPERPWQLSDTIPAALVGLGVAARLASPRRRTDPSPSRLVYRLNRLWLTPLFRKTLTMGLPSLLLAGSVAVYLSDDARRAAVTGFASELQTAFHNRPEFRVETLSVQAESDVVAQAIHARLDADLPASSFTLDLDALRQRVELLDAVETAALRIRPGGVLEVAVIEREPAFVWRHADGLALIDAEGHRVALLRHRAARPDLPLIAGEGAPQAVAEARRLLAAAAPLGDRLHALVRVGARRWDLVLDGDRRIMLPPHGAVTALERVLALDNQPLDLLSRDLVVVDMRNPDRPTLRLTETSLAELQRNRSPETGARPR